MLLRTATGADVVSLSMVRDWGRLPEGDDTGLASLIAACEDNVENLTGCAIRNNTYQLDVLPQELGILGGQDGQVAPILSFSYEIGLPVYPATRVNSIKRVLYDGTVQEVSQGAYSLDTNRNSIVVRDVIAFAGSPCLYYLVEFEAGYTENTIPNGLKQLLLGLIVYLWRNRDGLPVPEGFMSQLYAYRRVPY